MLLYANERGKCNFKINICIHKKEILAMLFDTHAHLNAEQYKEDFDEVIERA